MSPKSPQLRRQIVAIISDFADEGIFPSRVAKILNENKSTVRSLMIDLANEGKLIQNYREINGCYSVNPLSQNLGDGIEKYSFKDIQWQNINFVVMISDDITQDYTETREFPLEFERKIWAIKINICKNTKKLHIQFSGAPGYDPRSVMIVIDSIIRDINSKFHYSVSLEEGIFNSHEAFQDIYGISCSGGNITVSQMNKGMLKVYNKGFGCRIENKNFLTMPYDFLINCFANPILLNYSNDMHNMRTDLNSMKVDQIAKNKIDVTFKQEILSKLDSLIKSENGLIIKK